MAQDGMGLCYEEYRIHFLPRYEGQWKFEQMPLYEGVVLTMVISEKEIVFEHVIKYTLKRIPTTKSVGNCEIQKLNSKHNIKYTRIKQTSHLGGFEYRINFFD
jgi:hypothetical protein